MKIALVSLLLSCSARLFAQEAQDKEEKEPVAIIEIGAAPLWNRTEKVFNMRPTASVEFTLIPRWMKFEVGTSPAFQHHVTEWDTDFLFKKPFTVSKHVEILPGVGPAWIHTREDGVTTNTVALAAVLDFMFWPTASHKIGWYVEPGYEYNFAREHQHSIGFSAGILIAVGKK